METQTTRSNCRGRIFPEIQWSEEKKAQWKVERKMIYQRCKIVFDLLQPELIKTDYNSYLAVEPESGDYFIGKDELVAAQLAHQKYQDCPIHVFQINETGACGTL